MYVQFCKICNSMNNSKQKYKRLHQGSLKENRVFVSPPVIEIVQGFEQAESAWFLLERKTVDLKYCQIQILQSSL